MLKRIEGTLLPNRTPPVSQGLSDTDDTYPFTVDSHIRISVDAQSLDLWNIFDVFHVRCIASRSEYDSYFCAWINVMRCD